jgi:hypothetical protein
LNPTFLRPAAKSQLRPGKRYLWQFCLQVWAWLSQALIQGALSVVGQARLQESAWLVQTAKQASEAASANLSLSLRETALVVAAPIKMKNNAKANRGFIGLLRQMLQVETDGNPRVIKRAADVRFPRRFRPC